MLACFALQHTTGSFLNGIGEYKSPWVNTVNKVGELAYLEAGNNRKNDVTVVANVKAFFQVATFALIYGNTPAQLHYQFALNIIAHARYDGNPGVLLKTFYHIIQRT